MKNSGIVRKIDIHGRMVLPKDVRLHMGVADESLVEIILIEEGIIIKNYKPESDLANHISLLERSIEGYVNKHSDEKAIRIKKLLGDAMQLLKQ